jgi:hypothetical protein
MLLDKGEAPVVPETGGGLRIITSGIDIHEILIVSGDQEGQLAL